MGGRGASSSTIKNKREYDGKTNISGLGEVSAYKVQNLKPGDILQWNYGYTSKLIKIEPTKSGKSYKIKEKFSDTGNVSERIFRKNTLIAIGSYEAKNDKDLKLKKIARKI